MIRSRKFKYLVFVGLALVLAISLVASACAPAEGVVKREAFKVQTWEPSTWLPSGIIWDDLVYIADYITQGSDGRIVVTPSAPGAVCPVEEQLDAVATGATAAMHVWPGYFSGKIPITFAHGDCVAAPPTVADMRQLYEFYEGGRINELFQEEYAKYGVTLVGNQYWVIDNIITSNVPIYGVDELKGVGFRSSEMVAEALALLGAGTVWTPGGEIYTNLATGVVDACTYSNAYDAWSMSFHEVTKYWVKKPIVSGPGCDAFLVNPDVWNALPDDLKAIVKSAIDAGTMRSILTAEVMIDEAWKWAADYGIEIIEWPDEDCAVYYEALRSLLDKYREDPACAEMFDILDRYMVEKGYWK